MTGFLSVAAALQGPPHLSPCGEPGISIEVGSAAPNAFSYLPCGPLGVQCLRRYCQDCFIVHHLFAAGCFPAIQLNRFDNQFLGEKPVRKLVMVIFRHWFGFMFNVHLKVQRTFQRSIPGRS